MKASQTALARTIALAGVITLSACVPAPDSTPTPEPVQQVPAPAPTPAAQPDPTYANWLDAPQTPGNWSYSANGGVSYASFRRPDGSELVRLTCQPESFPIVILTRTDVVAAAITVRTETREQVLMVPPTTGVPTATSATIGVNWPLLDAIALTRGRFAVESRGAPTLYLPAWAEVTRVIEDCR